MFRRVRVKPSRSQSLVGMIGGAVFVVIGFSLMPMFGLFGIIWTLMAIAIAVLNAYNFFSNRGIASWEVDVDANNSGTYGEEDFDARLRKLNGLKEDGLITSEEFEKKRADIMKSSW